MWYIMSMISYMFFIVLCLLSFSSFAFEIQIEHKLAPKSQILTEDLIFEFKDFFDIAFKNQNEMQAFVDFAKENNQLEIKFVESGNHQLRKKSYYYSKESEAVLYLSKNVSFPDLLKFQQEYYNKYSEDLWLFQNGTWSMIKMLQHCAAVLVNDRILSEWGWNEELQNMAFSLAREFYRLTNPSKKNSIIEEKKWQAFVTKVRKARLKKEAIKKVKQFIFKDAENDVKKIQGIFKEKGKIELFNFINQRYKNSLVPLITQSLDDVLIKESLKNLDNIEISDYWVDLADDSKTDMMVKTGLQSQSRLLMDRMYFPERKMNFSQIKKALIKAKENDNSEELLKLQLDVLKPLNYQISKYAKQEAANTTIGKMNDERLAQCVGCTVLGGKILSELGFNVYTIQVTETYEASKTAHVALLVELAEGSFHVFDAAMPNAFAKINLVDSKSQDIDIAEKIKKLKLGDHIDYNHIDFDKDNKREEVQQFRNTLYEKKAAGKLTQKDLDGLPVTHPRFQILPYNAIYSCILSNLAVEYNQQQKHEEAIFLLNKSIALNKNYDYAYFNLGQAYLSRARFNFNQINDFFNKKSEDEEARIKEIALDALEKADQAFTKALDIDSNYESAKRGLYESQEIKDRELGLEIEIIEILDESA